MEFNKYIDHTLLKLTAEEPEFQNLCSEAMTYSFAAVCVPPSWVKLCKNALKSSNVKLATVVGFPLGYNLTETKTNEVKSMVHEGADEIDFVTNISWVKSGKYNLIANEYEALRDTAPDQILKVILETGALTETEIKKLCDLAIKYKLDFVKTSTGFYETGAKLSDVQLMKKHVGDSILIKASGGIKNFEMAEQFIMAGANRLGCSASVAIFKDSQGKL